jgi:alkyl sulfatase BDS1-like metallo-beta-lactamase superfamily hydrolase
MAPDLMGALTVEQVLASIAIRIDGPEAWDDHLVVCFVVTDLDTTYVVELRNGTMNFKTTTAPAPGAATLTLDRRTLIGIVTGQVEVAVAVADGRVSIDGDAADLARLVGYVAPGDRNFAIVTP